MIKEIEAFILTGHAFEANNQQALRLYGESNHGTFCATISHFQNYFFVENKNQTNLKSLDGKFVEKVFCQNQNDYKSKVNQFEGQNLRTYESDVRLLDRYLMDNEFFAQVDIKGEATFKEGIWHFNNPIITKGNYFPEVKIFSFDIETGKNGALLSLAYEFRYKEVRQSHCIVLGDGKETHNVSFARDEKTILQFFQKTIKDLDPDIITGWNVIGFDFKFINNKSRALNFPLYLGRSNKALDLYQNLRGEWYINLDGRVVIDGPRALKMNFFSFESFKLGRVAKDLLGESKEIDEDEVHDKWDEIERRFREDKLALASYNIKDAQLVLDIYEKTKIVDLLLNRSLISGMLLDRVGGSTAAFDHFYLPALHKKQIVALNTHDISWSRQGKGGWVFTPVVGVHANVLVMDFKSLYPTIIQTFKIDPLSNFYQTIEPVKTPVDLYFSRREHILPAKITELLDRRALAKKENKTNLSQAIKILMNSFYGVMGSDGCRFYHETLPDAVTGTGQWILKTVKEFLESKSYQVLYGDTDSIFVKVNTDKNIPELAEGLTEEINSFLQDVIKKDYNTESKLEIQFDKFFKSLVLTSSRGMNEGAKKKYAGLSVKEVNGKIVEEVIITGMEYVRSDWSMLARKFQFELLRRLFYAEDIEGFIKKTLEDLENGLLNDQLILSKRLSKPLDEYIKTVPPHAKAAKILYEKLGILTSRPRFIMTRRGPMPVELPCEDIDFEYYIEKQIAPIAQSVLSLINKSFDEYRKGQLSLF